MNAISTPHALPVDLPVPTAGPAQDVLAPLQFPPAVAGRPATFDQQGVPRPWAVGLAAAALVWPAIAGRLWGPHKLATGIWYRLLRQPDFKPPDAAIPIAWSVIDSALAVGAYRLLRRPDSAARNRALAWWALNVGLIGGWSGLFFGRRNLPASTAVAAAMVGTGAAYVVQARAVDRPAAAAGVPFVAWVAFATVLTAAIWRRNR